MDRGTLHFLCGKMAAGKSTFARALARTHEAILLGEDHFLATLFGGEIHSVADYLTYSQRVRDALSGHIVTLLQSGVTVVLDFPGNTPTQRRWFRQLIDRAQAAHELHYLDVSDDVCKAQLKERSRDLPPETPWTTDAEFEAITSLFQPPSADEGFNITRAPRTSEEGLKVIESIVGEEVGSHWYARPVLFASDIQRALRFYIDELGFERRWHEDEGKGKVCQVDRGGCEIILCEDGARTDKARLFVELNREGIDELRREIEERSLPTQKAWWGYDVIRIADPDGNELLFPLDETNDREREPPR